MDNCTCTECLSKKHMQGSSASAYYVPKLQEIEDIIQDYVEISEGNYGWGGQEYILTHVNKAASKILELIQGT